MTITRKHVVERRPGAPHVGPRTGSVVVLPPYREIDNLSRTVARIRASVPRAGFASALRQGYDVLGRWWVLRSAVTRVGW